MIEPRTTPLPPLSGLRAFEAAARHLNFTRAGEELGMTQSAVSYQIKLLEERVGSPLFVRHARDVSLTEVGQRLAPGIMEAFELMRTTVASARETAHQSLSITTIQTFASHWLVQHIGAFHLTHPDIAVRIEVSTAVADFARDGFDLAIRAGRGVWPGLETHRLMSLDFTPLVAPSVAAKLNTPADLLDLHLLNPSDDWWPVWLKAAGLDPEIEHRSQLELDSHTLTASMVMAGEGVGLLTPGLFKREIEAGLMVQPFDIVCDVDYGYWLAYPKARRNAAPIRAFREWILEEFARTAPPEPTGDVSIMD